MNHRRALCFTPLLLLIPAFLFLHERQLADRRLEAALQQIRDLPDSTAAPGTGPWGDFLLRYGSPAQRVKVWFLRGYREFQAGDLSQALCSFERALESFREEDGRYYGGLAHRYLADIYGMTCHLAEDSLHLREARRLFAEDGNRASVQECLLGLAIVHRNDRDWDGAARYFQELERSGPMDSILQAYALVDRALLLVEQEEKYPDTALSLFRKAVEDYGYHPGPEENVEWAYMLHLAGDPLGLAIITDLAESGYRSALLDYRSYLIFGDRQDRQASLSCLEDAFFTLESESRKQLSTQVAKVRDEYRTLSLANTRERVRYYRSRNRGLLAFFLAAALSGFLLFRDWRRRKEQEESRLRTALEKTVELAGVLEGKVRKSRKECSRLRKDLDERNRRIDGLQSRFLSAYRMQFTDIARLYLDMEETKDYREREKGLYNRALRLLQKIGGDERDYVALKKDIDRTFDHVLSDLQRDLPDLTEDEERLFCYAVLGFDGRLTSLLLHLDNADAVYSRKYRLKRKLTHIPAGSRNRYLSFLD